MELFALPKVWPTVVHMLAAAAREMHGHIALVCGDEQLTYRHYAACAAGFAEQLAAAGVAAGDRIATLMSNCIDLPIAILGTQAAGAQIASLNPDYTAAELAPILTNAKPRLILASVDVAARLSAALAASGVEIMVIGVGAIRLTAWPDDAALAKRLPLPDPAAFSTLQYTGGTTGRSKGANLTHAAVAVNISQRQAVVPMRSGSERILVITPLFHVYAAAMGLYAALYSCSTLVILPRYRPDLTLAAITQHRITVMAGSPTIYTGLLGFEGLAEADLSSLVVSVSGSAALPEEILRQWEARTGSVVIEGYGQTESGPVLTFNPVHAARKVGSVGVLVPEAQVEIVDLESGEVFREPGKSGEIRALGPQLMTGYRDLPEETAEALRNGWLYTGDIGEFDAEGYLYIRGRRKDMVIVGGYNVYPREIEDALYTHPSVVEAAVFGIPDRYRGEALVAVVTSAAQTSQQDLQAYLAGRLVKYKLPSRFVFQPSLPKTTVGKIDKTRLRQDLLPRLLES